MTKRTKILTRGDLEISLPWREDPQGARRTYMRIYRDIQKPGVTVEDALEEHLGLRKRRS